jgi:hypothetical protein
MSFCTSGQCVVGDQQGFAQKILAVTPREKLGQVAVFEQLLEMCEHAVHSNQSVDLKQTISAAKTRALVVAQ